MKKTVAAKVGKGLFFGVRKWIWIGAAAVVLAGGAAASYTVFFTQPAEPPERPVFAPNAQIGILPGKTEEQIQEMLTKQIDENTVAFSINSNAVFDNGRAKGNLMLESPSNNINYIEFVIRRDDSGETIYRSGLLKPNQYILEDTLQAKAALKKGVYACTADITLYDRQSLEAKGMVQAALKVIVKN